MPALTLRPVTTGDTALVLDNGDSEPETMPVMLATPDTLWLQRDDGELTGIEPDLVVPGEYIASITELESTTGEVLYRIALTPEAPRQAIARRWIDLVDLFDLTLGRTSAHSPLAWLNLRGQTPDGVCLALALPYDRRSEPQAVTFLGSTINRDQNRVLSRVLNGPDL